MEHMLRVAHPNTLTSRHSGAPSNLLLVGWVLVTINENPHPSKTGLDGAPESNLTTDVTLP
jgi:hypothetical protein